MKNGAALFQGLISLGAFLAFMLMVSQVRASVGTQGDWNVAVLNQLLAGVQPGQQLVQVGDMEISASVLQSWRDQLAGGPQAYIAFNNGFTQWTGGNIYYTFDASVGVPEQRVFLSAAAQWSTFANVHFIPRGAQVNYVVVTNNPNLTGGLSAVGMVGGPQLLQVGPTSWNEGTLVHEIGHVLGLVHEHQRSDRDNYVFINTNNIATNELFNFVLLPSSLNMSAYDFRSVMHYARNAFSVDPSSNTIVPLPVYTNYLNVMGQSEPPLSTNDRAGMVSVYGAGPGDSSVVTNTLDSGPGSLRLALYYASDHPGTTVTFNIPMSDPGFSNKVFNILLSDALPSLFNAVTINGASEPVAANLYGPQILLNGIYTQPLSDFASGIQIKGTNCVVRSLTINNFAYFGVNITTNAVGNTVSGCYLGVDPTGSNAVPNAVCPVQITGGAISNIIGGTTMAARNIIGGSLYQGIAIREPGTCYNVVEGNYIGVNAAGTAALPNALAGVEIFEGAQSNLIGGYVSGARNVLSGNIYQGVALVVTNTSGNIVAGNYVGLNALGTSAIPNGAGGVEIFSNAFGNVIGGTQPGAGNVLSGNTAQGVAIGSAGTVANGNVVQGNLIGLNATGTAAVPNGGAGVGIFNGAESNLIGGTVTSARNIISGNALQGVVIGDGATWNLVQGNYIGLNPAGAAAIANGGAGVNIFSANENLVGGTIDGAGNVISGNGGQGVLIQYTGTVSNYVEGNIIGMNAAGTAAVANTWSGIEINNGTVGNVIGGIGGARNFISGNGNYGIWINFGSSANVVQGNTIGLNISNNAAIPNIYAGVTMYVDATSNLVGGTTIGAANLIAGNASDGVQAAYDGATNNVIRGNSIFGNSGSGISVYGGGNNDLAAPTLTSAVVTTNLTINGSYSGVLGAVYQLDFYSDAAPTYSAQAKTYLGSKTYTGTGGSSAFTAKLGVVVTNGRSITASITDPAGNTSTLSAGVAASMTSSVNDGIPDAWRAWSFGAPGTMTNIQSDAFADPDHDGMNNFQEFLAGTNPTNAASVFKVTAANPYKSTNAVVLNSANGTVYQVQYRDDLIAGNWQILADQVIGNGTNLFLPDPGAASAGKRFYRAMVDY